MQTELSPLIISDDGSFTCRPATTSDLSRRHSVYTRQISFQVCSNNCLLCLISSGRCLHTTFEGSFGSSTRNWEKASIQLGTSKGWTQAYKVSTWCPDNSLNIIISSKGKKLREQGLEAMFESCSGERAPSSGRALPWTGTQDKSLSSVCNCQAGAPPASHLAALCFGFLPFLLLIFQHLWGRVSHYFLM